MSDFSSIEVASAQLAYSVTDYKRWLTQEVLSLTSFLSTVEAQLISLQARIASNPETVTEDSLDGALAGVQTAAKAIKELTSPSASTDKVVAIN